MTTKDRLELSIKVIALFVGLFGVAAYFLDRHSERLNLKRGASMELLSQFYGPNVTEHRQVVFEFWLNNRELFLAMENSDLSDREIRAVYLDAFTNGSNETMQSAIFRLAEFYDRVGFCTKSAVCDAKETKDIFCADAALFHGAYGRYLGQIGERSGYPSLGQRLEWFVNTC